MTTEIEEQQDAAKWASETPTDKLIQSYKVWQETIAQGKMRLAAIEHELTARMGQNAVIAGNEWAAERDKGKPTYEWHDVDKLVDVLSDLGVPDYLIADAIQSEVIPEKIEWKVNKTKWNQLRDRFPDAQRIESRYLNTTTKPGPLKVRRIDGQ